MSRRNRAERNAPLPLFREEQLHPDIEPEVNLTAEAIGGAFDGMTSVAGLIVAMVTHSTYAVLIMALVLSLASVIGLGAGEHLAQTHGAGRLRRITMMGGTSLVSTLVPAAPFLFLSRTPAIVVGAVLAAVLILVLGRAAHRGMRGFIEAMATLVFALVLTLLISLALPSTF